MDGALLDFVFDRLEQQRLAEEPTDLLLAALDGDDALASQLKTDPAERYPRPASPAPAADPVGAYLSSITVEGFRGIGPESKLTIKEGPGLTLVVGRNGSGKSSFAEGLEVLLTGNLVRLKAAPAVVREGWRCKHSALDPSVKAEFYVEGKGRTNVGRSWPATSGNDVGQSEAWVQFQGEKQEPLQALGWDADLVEYRPFLSYAEVGAFFGRPSELYDLLANVLGLEGLTGAAERLRIAAKAREDRLDEVKRDLEQLRPRLATLAGQDERAESCLRALAGTRPANWDIDAAVALVIGSGPQLGHEGHMSRLRRLANLTTPLADDVTHAVAALRGAVNRLASLADSTTEHARDLAALLDAALGHHQSHGDGIPCPVCGNPGALTPQWRAATEQHRDLLRQEARTAEEAAAEAETAAARARELVQGIPQPLHDVTADDPPAAAPVAQAWHRWAHLPEVAASRVAESLIALADHLETAYHPLAAGVTSLVQQASDELASRDDQWSPLAKELAVWCDAAVRARSDAEQVTPLKTARAWLAEAIAELRDQRLAPLADQSRRIWADLRQESNVSLGAFRLSGANTRRQLDLDVTIDGEPASALGVMSQGEVNALALAIFLSRALFSASPFRFLILDDPVQALDPTKVDGLATVLGQVARERQVVVFTHDNRLVTAVKEQSIPVMVAQVTRMSRSKIEVEIGRNESEQALSDAHAITKDPNVPLPVAQRVVPGLCRTAVEAAFIEAYWRLELRRGVTKDAIEKTIDSRPLNMRRAAVLALFGDAGGNQSVSGQLNRWAPRWGTLYRELNEGAHEGSTDNLANLIENAGKLVREIAERLK